MKKMAQMVICGMALVATLDYGLVAEAVDLPANAALTQGTVEQAAVNWDALVNTKVADLKNPSYGSANPFKSGLCTWYAWGRMKEVTGKSITFKTTPAHANNWSEKVTNCVVNGRLTPKCVAFKVGHVAFVEHVEGPNVYYTEDNVSKSTDYKVIKTTVSEFKKEFTLFFH